MSNDEQAWYVEAEAPAEPDRVLHRMVETPAEPDRFRVGTVAPATVALDPVQPRERMGGLLQPTEQGVPTLQHPVEPLQPLLADLPAQPLLPRQQDLPAEPLQPLLADLPAEPLQPQRVGLSAPTPDRPVEPAYAPLRPMERGEPLSRPTAARADKRTAAPRNAASGSGSSGGAGTGFQVDPEQYRAAVSPMLAASEQLADLHRSLSAFLTSMESQNPWGNDESGKKFAEGEKGYLKYSHDTMAVVKGLPGALKNIADGLKAMADSYQNADENIVADLGGIESTAQMPTAPSLPSAPVNPIISTRPIQSGRH
ncbi:hypothetical protein ACFY00_03165 [Kitasatospora sp. NPDC001540]|uniref:WXG100 family type VII secretion target n=1 Tax=Kitasatospora sp. NPDC001540 TaxID=3364014 RepID=UPI00369CD914